MKKTLIIGILILAVVTSMVAGTLAIYSKTLDYNGELAAKVFDIRETTNNNIDIKLAPGETDKWGYKLTNTTDKNVATEVDMDVTTSITLPQEFSDVDVTLNYFNGEGKKLGVTNVSRNGNTLTFSEPVWSKAGVAKTVEYEMDFVWKDNGQANNDQTKIGAAAVTKPVSVTITGTQSVPK